MSDVHIQPVFFGQATAQGLGSSLLFETVALFFDILVGGQFVNASNGKQVFAEFYRIGKRIDVADVDAPVAHGHHFLAVAKPAPADKKGKTAGVAGKANPHHLQFITFFPA